MIGNDFRNRIRKAVLKGINEAFDIEDMGHSIETAATAKQGIRKVSKAFDHLTRLLDGNPLKTEDDFFRLSNVDQDFVIWMHECYDDLEPDVIALIEENDLEDFIKDKVKVYIVGDLVETILQGNEPSEQQRKVYDNILSKVHSKDDDFYAVYPAEGTIQGINLKYDLRYLIAAVMGNFGDEPNLNWIDVSHVWHMGQLFSSFDTDVSGEGCYDLFNFFSFNDDESPRFNEDYEGFVRDFFGGFDYIDNFNGDISLWDVSHVQYMNGMFVGSSFNGDISGWDVSNVVNMEMMFAMSEFNRDISKWDVHNVTDMCGMFAQSGFNGDISGWDVSHVRTMLGLFYQSSFRQDISEWQINVNNCDKRKMFVECEIPEKHIP